MTGIQKWTLLNWNHNVAWIVLLLKRKVMGIHSKNFPNIIIILFLLPLPRFIHSQNINCLLLLVRLVNTILLLLLTLAICVIRLPSKADCLQLSCPVKLPQFNLSTIDQICTLFSRKKPLWLLKSECWVLTLDWQRRKMMGIEIPTMFLTSWLRWKITVAKMMRNE